MLLDFANEAAGGQSRSWIDPIRLRLLRFRPTTTISVVLNVLPLSRALTLYTTPAIDLYRDRLQHRLSACRPMRTPRLQKKRYGARQHAE